MVRVFTPDDLLRAMRKAELSHSHLVERGGDPTELGAQIIAYSKVRAEMLNNRVQALLMDAPEAQALFEEICGRVWDTCRCHLPMNKQKGEKKANAYLTCMVNMTIEECVGGRRVEYNPKQLTSFTADDIPVRTLARRVDGAFPSIVNPIAVWEIKEYYYTTTFGSRVADGVYETLLDGMELSEFRETTNRSAFHYLFVDSRRTWWEMGRSYLCRLIDLLHMGYVTEVIFGREVVTRLPELAAEWIATLEAGQTKKMAPNP